MEIAEQLEREERLVELGITPPDVLVEMLDELIQQEILPSSYLMQLGKEILRYRKGDYDIETSDCAGKLEGKPHPGAMIRISYLLFAARILNFEIMENLRRENQPKLAKEVHNYIRKLEVIARCFDSSYKSQLGVVKSPSLSMSFWDNRESHPCETTRALIAEAYL